VPSFSGHDSQRRAEKAGKARTRRPGSNARKEGAAHGARARLRSRRGGTGGSGNQRSAAAEGSAEGPARSRPVPPRRRLTPCRRPPRASDAFYAACDWPQESRRRRHLPRTSNASNTRPWRAAELPPWQRRRRGDGSAPGTKFLNAKRTAAAQGAGPEAEVAAECAWSCRADRCGRRETRLQALGDRARLRSPLTFS
jgi:hypothetical protein